MTREIPLTRGMVTLVDDDRYEDLAQFGWYAHSCSNGRYFYAARRLSVAEGHAFIFMHRIIVSIPEGMHPDHRNGDTLDNRAGNLRPATRQQNQQNRRPFMINSPKVRHPQFKGVYRSGPSWSARITTSGKTHHLGCSADPAVAAALYDAAARGLFGEFARLNFPAAA